MRKALAPWIDKADIYRFLHVHGEPPEDLQLAVEQGLEEVFAAAVFRFVQKEAVLIRQNGGISLDGEIPLPYPSLEKLFQNSRTVYVIACTIGPEIMRRIKRALLTDAANGVIIDACASVVADAYAAYLQSELLGETTMRFSPGYGDVPLHLQRDLFAYLDITKRIGIYLSKGDLMIPEKSVVFMAGDGVCETEEAHSLCANCTNDCAYRKEAQ